jgi:hypothetical protein
MCCWIAAGNFSLLERLMSLCESEGGKDAGLDLAGTDKGDNTLLHVACQSNYNKHSHKAVEMLVTKDVPVDARNKEGK